MKENNITIIHFVFTLYGGVANVAAALINYQYSKGYKVVLAYNEYDAAIEEQLNVPVEKIKCPMRGYPGESMMFGMNINRVLKKYKKDHPLEKIIIHAHNVQTIGAFANIKKLPIICTLHGFNAVTKSRKKMISDFLYRKTLNKLLKNDKSITAVSHAIVESDECKKVKNHDKISVIYNFAIVDETMKKIHKTFNIGHVGDLSNEKGWDTVWKAYGLLPSEYRRNIYFYSAGKESDYTKQWIDDNLKGVEYKNHIIYDGYVKNAKEDFISKLDLLVLASRNEGLGLVQIEAMGYGIPVLGRNTGGICEVLKDGYNGFVILDEKDLCEKIKLLYDDRELYNQLSRNAQITYKTKFSRDIIMKEYQKIYDDIIREL